MPDAPTRPAGADPGSRIVEKHLARSIEDQGRWMGMDADGPSRRATRLTKTTHGESAPERLDEALPRDDYWGYAELRRSVPRGMLRGSGRHNATRRRLRMRLDMECGERLRLDAGRCGGSTGPIRIAAIVDALGARLNPEGRRNMSIPR